MAEKEFLIATRARDLLQYTYTSTKPKLADGENGKVGFSKSSYRLYGADMRECAKRIVMSVHGANFCDVKTERERRQALQLEALEQCSLMLEYIQLCVDAHLVSIAHAGEWTSKTMDVKRAVAGWRRNERQRAQ